MKSKVILTADDAKTLATAAEQHARANNWAVVIAVVDDGGHLLHLHRMDGAAPISSTIAPGKAEPSRTSGWARCTQPAAPLIGGTGEAEI